MSLQHTKPKLLKNLFELDSYLKPYENEIVRRLIYLYISICINLIYSHNEIMLLNDI